MKRFICAISILFVLATMVGTATAAPLVFKFAGQSPPDHQTSKHMLMIAKEINERTEGRVEIKVYPASQLGDYTLLFEEMMRGTVDMELGGVPSDFDPRLGMGYICGYVRGYDSLSKIFDPDGWMLKKLNEISNPLGVRMLSCYVEGMIGIGSVKPVKEPLSPKVDKGVLTRVANMEVYTVGAKAMGYRPITIPWPDTYQALQTGVCDAAIGFPTASAYMMFADVIKYWYATNYSLEYQAIMISEKSWQKLTEKDRLVFQDIARKYSQISIANAKAQDRKYLDLMKKKGIKVFEYNDKQLEDIRKACFASWDELAKGSLTKPLIDEFKREFGDH